MSFYGIALIMTALVSSYIAAFAYAQLRGAGVMTLLPYDAYEAMTLRTSLLAANNSVYSGLSVAIDGTGMKTVNGTVVAVGPSGMYCVSGYR
ncbi:MAG: hypothetical protein M1321_03085 [Candidatus Marsarchaeota archaeon]|nr:hypothetical protein [Candidatus Marsarchaeota archaeon]